MFDQLLRGNGEARRSRWPRGIVSGPRLAATTSSTSSPHTHLTPVSLFFPWQAYTLLSAPQRAPAPRMNFEQLSQPHGVHLDYEDFRFSTGGPTGGRQLGGDGRTAFTTPIATAETAHANTVAHSAGTYYAPAAPRAPKRRTAATFGARFGDNGPAGANVY